MGIIYNDAAHECGLVYGACAEACYLTEGGGYEETAACVGFPSGGGGVASGFDYFSEEGDGFFVL